jgi:transposase
MAFELSSSRWRVVFGDGRTSKRSECEIKAGDREALVKAISKAKDRLGLPQECKVLSCYEAGRDGFWIHRLLAELGVENVVIDSSSILVNRQSRRAKTDHLDAHALHDLLVRYSRGESGVWKVVTVPTQEQEDARRLHRERERLVKERGGHQVRAKALLALCGVKITSLQAVDLGKLRQWDGTALPPELLAELEREQKRHLLADQQLKALEKERGERMKQAAKDAHAGKEIKASEDRALMLEGLVGIGEISAWTLAHELLWRQFKNRRQVASATGLTPTPYNSGGSTREQGISKAGNPQLRKLLIELAWGWLRFQRDSKLSRWFQERFASGGSRMRRVGIVAMARRLVVDLWRYVETGAIPEGVKLRLDKA